MKIAKAPVKRSVLLLTLLTFLFGLNDNALASKEKDQGGSHSQEEGFNPGDVIIHHIKDSYKWHFFSIGNFDATVYFPVILYSADKGLVAFNSKHLYQNDNYRGFKLDHNEIKSATGASVYDFSLTKNVASMLVSALLMLWIFLAVAKRYKQQPAKPPRGLQSLLEPIIIFIRDEVTKPVIGKDWHKYFPYIITVFFFIWINNLLGLLPGAANVTGNIAVTLCLALITFLIVNVNGTKDYWKHIFNTPGVPWWLKIPVPLMPAVEFLSIFTKPFALTVRLFANITAGHLLILSVISLIFIFGQQSASLGYGIIAPISIGFTIFLYFIELLVAVVQAYIFAMLSAVFIGESISTHHEDEEAEEAMVEGQQTS